MKIVEPVLVLDRAAVLRVIDDIDGDGDVVLDPAKLITLGLPDAFVRKHTARHPAKELLIRFVEVAGPDAMMASVSSLSLLSALAGYYEVDFTGFAMGRSRQARALSEVIRNHLLSWNRDEHGRKVYDVNAETWVLKGGA